MAAMTAIRASPDSPVVPRGYFIFVRHPHIRQQGTENSMTADTRSVNEIQAGTEHATPAGEPSRPAETPREGRVIEALGYEAFGDLLRAHGFEAEPANPADRTTYRCVGNAVFVASLRAESPVRKGEYELITLTMYMPLPPAVLAPVYVELQQALQFVHAQVDDDGDLVVQVPIYVGGGVTEAHIARMFDYWRMTLEHVRQVINRRWVKTDPRVLN